MRLKIKHLFFVLGFCAVGVAFAQTPPFAQRDAMYLATLKAVLDYKMNDEENIKQLEKLRENKKFNRDLQKKLAKLHKKKTNQDKMNTSTTYSKILVKKFIMS